MPRACPIRDSNSQQSVVIGTDCIDSCKSNYYTNTATTANIASASVSNVNIVCYILYVIDIVCSKLYHLPNIASVTEISPHFFHSKPSIPGTRSGAQTYKRHKTYTVSTNNISHITVSRFFPLLFLLFQNFYIDRHEKKNDSSFFLYQIYIFHKINKVNHGINRCTDLYYIQHLYCNVEFVQVIFK